MYNLIQELIRCCNILLISLVSFNMLSCGASETGLNQPNIIIFLVDDMGLMDTSVQFLCDSEGRPKKYPLNSFYNTPNVEKLASKGIRFSNFYAHSVCSPSRISLLTGQNSARHGTTTWIDPQNNNGGEHGPSFWNWKGLTKESTTLPRLFQEAGYKTIHVGKAHFGPFNHEGENPLNLGFDMSIGGGAIGRPGSYYGIDGFGKIRGDSIRAVKNLEKYHGKEIFLTEALTIEAKAAISEAKKDRKSFFLYMSHYAVHSPFQPDTRFIDHYNNSEKTEREKAFATLIEGVDKSLGDIVNYVKELGIGENTLILFLGDNGSDAPVELQMNYGSSFPLKGLKGMHWEGGMRVPFIASWIETNEKNSNQKKMPIAQNQVQHQLGSIIDLFPTLCHVANISIPEEYICDGYDLYDQFIGEQNKSRREIFLNHFPHQHRSSYYTSLVDSDWKIIYHYPIVDQPHYELFYLRSDPFETTNLAYKNPAQLRTMMITLQKEMEDNHALYPEVEEEPLELIIPE